jgi:RNA polymerase sigma factor (sigma-70 family)
MATAQMDTVIRHLRRAVLRQDAAASTDGQLLASFIDHKDEAAFEALVRRHGPMVFGVCRRVVGNHHDAEDAFQATFLVLARKAPSVRPRERLANWLHGVALRTAMKAKPLTAKRRGREKQVTAMPEPEAAQQSQWPDLQPLLDQELNGLPANYRLPILLCDLQGKTIKDAAQQLGWPHGTLAGRLARGRKLLAKRLANRGVVLSAGSLATVISQNVASAGVPTALMSFTVKAATMIVAGQATVAGVVPARVVALTEGALKSMMLTKLSNAVAGLVVLAVVVFGGGLLTYTTAAGQQTSEQDSNQPAIGQSAPLKQDAGTVAGGIHSMRGFEFRGVGPFVNGYNVGGDFLWLNSVEYQIPVQANDLIYFVPFVDSGTVEQNVRIDYRVAAGVGARITVPMLSQVPIAADANAQARNDKEAEKDDKEKLQGTWQVVILETAGLRLDEGNQVIKGLKVRFSRNRITFIYADRDREDSFDYRVQSSDTPKGIQFWNEQEGNAEAYRGIYQVDENDLKIHLVKEGEAKLPTNFTPALGRNRWLYTLRREQPSRDRKRLTGVPMKERVPTSKSEVRFAVPPEKYRAIYDTTLGVLSDHFKIDDANRWDGCIDTCPAFVNVAPDAGGEKEPSLRHRATARITPLVEGGFSVEVIVLRERKVVPPPSPFTGDVKWEAAGRDNECERKLLTHIEKGVAVERGEPDKRGSSNPKAIPSEPPLPRPLQPVGPTTVTIQNARIAIAPGERISLKPVKTASGGRVRLEMEGITIEVPRLTIESDGKTTQLEASEAGDSFTSRTFSKAEEKEIGPKK